MIVLDQRVKALIASSDVAETIDIDRYVASRLGTAIHSSIEHSWSRSVGGVMAFKLSLERMGYPQKVIDLVRVNPTPEELIKNPDIVPVYMEQRAYKKVGNYTVGGQFDFIGAGVLEDFKSMGVYGYMKGDKDEEQLMQGSLYRWLNQDLVTSDWMRIQQIFTDWSKLQAMIKIKSGYPQARIIEKKLTLKPVDEIEAWVTERIGQIELMADMPEAELPRCTQKELWQDPTTYQYFKNPDGKRATKNYNNFPEAQTHLLKDGNVGIVKEKLGKVKRCAYCSAIDMCSQAKEYLDNGTLVL